MAAPRYIAVEGVIGVGKTSLVAELARRLRARTVYEEFENNPFLPEFYKDAAANAFKTQIFFLMSRFRQQAALAQGDLFHEATVADYAFLKDRIFAVLTLKDHELELYDRLYDVLAQKIPTPDVIIHLVADLDAILGRIKARGRSYEQSIEREYLADLKGAYADFFRGYRGCPVIHVDTTKIDLRYDMKAVDRIVSAIERGEDLPGEALPLFAKR